MALAYLDDDDTAARDGFVLPRDLQVLAESALDAGERVHVAEGVRVERMVRLVRTATGNRVGAQSALGALATLFGTSRQAIQEYATVGARWSDARLAELQSLRDRNGRPLGLSRLVALARLPSATRSATIERALSEGLSVREIRSLSRAERGGPSCPR
jgi:hypothetical protein